MDNYNSWKRMEETEIDLTDLLYRLCMKWKQIAVCALAAAVIFGGYGWMKGRKGTDENLSHIAQEAVLAEEEEQAVADAVRLEKETRELKTYLENSILMQLDPYHKTKYIMLYSIDHVERRELPAVTESYLNYVLNGGAADTLAKDKKWDMDKSYLAEVVSAYQKTYSLPYQIVTEELADSLTAETLFYVEITGRDAEEAEKMALDMQTVLEKYSASVKKTAGNHRLKLVSSGESVTADSGLQTQQHDKQSLLSSNKASLKAVTDAFSKEQMAVYVEEAGLEDADEDEKTDPSDENASVESSGFSIKYVFLGLIGGIFAYCSVFACWYVFHDTVKNTAEMKRQYTFPVYGEIPLSKKDRKHGETVSGINPDAYGQTEEQVLNRIRLMCQKQGITALCAAVDFPLDGMAEKCLESMAEQLKKWGIDMAVTEKASADTAAWDRLAKTGNVLMVCRIGTTTHRMIDDAMNFYLENGITVMGAVAFL